MSSSDHGRASASSPSVRPLPPRPSLEFERKQAKGLLRALKRGDPHALARARAQERDHVVDDPTAYRLADAQFTIAREYGFRSWPRLVEYFAAVERHEKSDFHGGGGPPKQYEREVRSIIESHRRGEPLTAHALAAFVPRFFGSRIEELVRCAAG